MLIIEYVLCLILLVVLARATYTDFYAGKIYNSTLLRGCVLSLVADFIYYGVWAYRFLPVFLSNFLLLVLTGILFYALRIWAAGDSKLLFFIGLCIPGRWYTFQPFGPASSFAILVYAFSAAFLWLVILGGWRFLKNPHIGKIRFSVVQVKRWLVFYLCFSSLIFLFRFFLSSFLEETWLQNWLFQQTMNSFFLLFLLQSCARKPVSRLFFLGCLGWASVLRLMFFHKIVFSIALSGSLLCWALLLIPLRLVLHRFCYQSIPTSSVKPGQILSASTVLDMQKSRVRGLPQLATEDLEARLSESETESIRRWEFSKYGQSTITIVRKVPFAIFIFLGTLFFLIVGGKG